MMNFDPEVYKSGTKALRTLIEGIGDYLTRVVGSVPIDLKITLRVRKTLALPSPVTVIGPLYYEGQGQAMSESAEEEEEDWERKWKTTL